MDPATTSATVLFDADCSLCRTLAELVARRTVGQLRFRPWQDFQQSVEALGLLGPETVARPADRLRVLDGTTLHEGEAAWRYLLEHYRDLSGLNWMAAKLGLSTQAAQAVGGGAALLRRLCLRCPK